MKSKLFLAFSGAIISIALCVPGSVAQAGMVATDEFAATETARDVDAERAKVQAFLERASVKERLQAMGVEGIQAQQRVDAMTGQEIHALAQKIDALPAGGNLDSTDWILILLGVILLVLLL